MLSWELITGLYIEMGLYIEVAFHRLDCKHYVSLKVMLHDFCDSAIFFRKYWHSAQHREVRIWEAAQLHSGGEG